jgi:hypothetical protein
MEEEESAIECFAEHMSVWGVRMEGGQRERLRAIGHRERERERERFGMDGWRSS